MDRDLRASINESWFLTVPDHNVTNSPAEKGGDDQALPKRRNFVSADQFEASDVDHAAVGDF